MSYKEALSSLEREGAASLTQQLVDLFSAAIASGELAPGEQLPPTRELAEAAAINHLTAARAYRRLAELGLVTATVGRGTFVRRAPAPALEAALAGGGPSEADDWQLYVLPEEAGSYSSRVVADQFRYAEVPGIVSLASGYAADELLPVEQVREAAAAALADHGERALQYVAAEGVPELREQIARLAKGACGMADGPENIVVTSGARQGLTVTMRALLRPGDVAACEAPTFIGILESLRDAGATVLPVWTDEDGLDTDALEELLRRHEIRVLALQPQLQNPTGRDLSPERRERLLELARRHSFFIVEDAVYADLRYEGASPGPLRPELPSHVVYVDSFSKTVGGGLRVGWVAAQGPVLDRIVEQKRADDFHSPTLIQLTAARFLAEGGYEAQLERSLPFYRERRDALLAAVERHLGELATALPPLGGHHVWLTLRRPLDERELYREAVRHGVTFVPGGAMMPQRPRHTHMRLSFPMLSPQQLDEGARRLARAIRSLGRTQRAPQALPVT